MDTYEHENPGFESVEPEVIEPAVSAAEQDVFQPAAEVTNPEPKKSTFAEAPHVRAEAAPQPIKNGYAFPGNMPKASKQKKSSNKKPLRIAALAVSVVLLVVASCNLGANLSDSRWEKEMKSLTESFNQKIAVLEEKIDSMDGSGNSVSGTPAAAEGLTPGQVYARNKNAVVAISSVTQVIQFGQASNATSTGSGFILTEDGYVVTNYHVIEGADEVNVITFDGTQYRATVKGYDANNDLAVLKIEAEGLQAATLGSSNDLIIGDMVVAIGNPLGELTSTQTVGYISGKDRDVATDGTIINMLQTDAAINPGNSGGPLFNMKGEVIGITTAKYSGTTNSGASIEGIGFAIPIDDVTKMIADIMAHGYVTGPYLGVSVKNISQDQASYYGSGALVAEVVSGYSAARGGVQVGDLIIAFGGYDIDSVTALTRALRNFEAGDTVSMTVLRQGREVVLTLTLDEKPNGTQDMPDENSQIPMPNEGSYEDWYKYFFGQEPEHQP